MGSRSKITSNNETIENQFSRTSWQEESDSKQSRTSKESESQNDVSKGSIDEIEVGKIPSKDRMSGERKMLKDFKKNSITDYIRNQLEKSPLFQKIYTNDSITFKEEPTKTPSILITGFGMRNLRSLQDALKIEEERKRLLELYRRMAYEKAAEEAKSTSFSTKSSTSFEKSSTTTSSKSVSSETETQKPMVDTQQKLSLEYLLGLERLQGEAEDFVEEVTVQASQPEKIDGFKLSYSKRMRKAQIYLLQHNILEFFQFIVAHLLGASPENPIVFIIELLNKCLLYRSRLGQPPILYEKKHLEQLFNMMDKMRTGCIDRDQYVKGITSLGMCDYNESPLIDKEGCISKKVFIEEAYNAQVNYFNELIKISQEKCRTESSTTSDLEALTMDSSGSYFMPSGLLTPLQKPKVSKPTNF